MALSSSKSSSVSVDNRVNNETGAKVFDSPNYWPFAISAIVLALAWMVVSTKKKRRR